LDLQDLQSALEQLNYQDPDFAEEGQRGLEMAALEFQPEVRMLGLMNQQRISPGYLRRQ